MATLTTTPCSLGVALCTISCDGAALIRRRLALASIENLNCTFCRFHFHFSSRTKESVMIPVQASELTALTGDRLKQLKCEGCEGPTRPRGLKWGCTQTHERRVLSEASEGRAYLSVGEKIVVDSKIEASWVQLNSGVFVSPRT
jgi:hypothetical protein